MQNKIVQMKALANETRAQMMLELTAGPLTNTQLVERVGLSKGKISDHLNVLRDAGLILTRVSGRRRFHTINDEEMDDLRRFLHTLTRKDPS